MCHLALDSQTGKSIFKIKHGGKLPENYSDSDFIVYSGWNFLNSYEINSETLAYGH